MSLATKAAPLLAATAPLLGFLGTVTGMMAGGYITLDNPDHERRDALPRQVAKKLAKMLKKNPDRMAPIELSNNQQAD